MFSIVNEFRENFFRTKSSDRCIWKILCTMTAKERILGKMVLKSAKHEISFIHFPNAKYFSVNSSFICLNQKKVQVVLWTSVNTSIHGLRYWTSYFNTWGVVTMETRTFGGWKLVRVGVVWNNHLINLMLLFHSINKGFPDCFLLNSTINIYWKRLCG